MATSLVSGKKQEASIQQRVGGLSFDRLMLALVFWFVGGLYLDGWAHSHIPQLETFVG